MITPMLAPVVLAATTEYSVYPGREFVANLGLHASLEFSNGAEWKSYSADKDFVFLGPASGLIRVVIAGGQTAVAGFYPIN